MSSHYADYETFTDGNGKVWVLQEGAWIFGEDGMWIEGKLKRVSKEEEKGTPWDAGIRKIKEGERRYWEGRNDGG